MPREAPVTRAVLPERFTTMVSVPFLYRSTRGASGYTQLAWILAGVLWGNHSTLLIYAAIAPPTNTLYAGSHTCQVWAVNGTPASSLFRCGCGGWKPDRGRRKITSHGATLPQSSNPRSGTRRRHPAFDSQRPRH